MSRHYNAYTSEIKIQIKAVITYEYAAGNRYFLRRIHIKFHVLVHAINKKKSCCSTIRNNKQV